MLSSLLATAAVLWFYHAILWVFTFLLKFIHLVNNFTNFGFQCYVLRYVLFLGTPTDMTSLVPCCIVKASVGLTFDVQTAQSLAYRHSRDQPTSTKHCAQTTRDQTSDMGVSQTTWPNEAHRSPRTDLKKSKNGFMEQLHELIAV